MILFFFILNLTIFFISFGVINTFTNFKKLPKHKKEASLFSLFLWSIALSLIVIKLFF